MAHELAAEALARSTTPSRGPFSAGHAPPRSGLLGGGQHLGQPGAPFRSALALMRRHPQLHFGHSNPRAHMPGWRQHRPTLFERDSWGIRPEALGTPQRPLGGERLRADQHGFALRQFQKGTGYRPAQPSRIGPMSCLVADSFGLCCRLGAWRRPPACAGSATHKLAWNDPQPLSPIDCFAAGARRSGAADPGHRAASAAMASGGRSSATGWKLATATGCADALWLARVGDTAVADGEMLEQLALCKTSRWRAVHTPRTVRAYLGDLEASTARANSGLARYSSTWKLHRCCATQSAGSEAHNRSLERLLRER